MALPVIDTFNDTTGVLLQNHHPDSDPTLNWLLVDTGATLDLFNGYGGILAVKTDISTIGAMAYIDVDLGSDDQVARFAPKLLSPYNPANESDFKYGDGGVLLRVTHADSFGSTKLLTGYLCYYRYKTHTWWLARLTVNTSVPGTPSQTLTDLASIAAPTPMVIGEAQRFFDFEVSGTNPVQLTLKEGSTTILSYSDSNAERVQTGRRPGIKIRAVNGNDPYLNSVEYNTLTTATVINCGVGSAAATGLQASVTNLNGTINCGVGTAQALGLQAAISQPPVVISCSVGVASALGLQASIVSAIVSDVLINNTGTILATTAVVWTWTPAGRIGSMQGLTPVDGTGTTDSTGRLSTGITYAAGRLDVAVRGATAKQDAVYQQYF